MQFTIVTGMSGSGKTRVIRYLEDIGYFCIDNMPPALIPKFSEMLSSANGGFENVAFVVDVRVGDMINELMERITVLKETGCDVRILFLNADDETLVKRYKETRRAHPVYSSDGLLSSIRKEREILERLLENADYIIDTTGMSNSELIDEVKGIYCRGKGPGIKINVMAFGFKYGIPMDADLVFDVRCFPNPFYIEELKNQTGNDEEVQEYVMNSPSASDFFEKLKDMMRLLVPLYEKEGKISLTIAMGCTGGKHRSVTMANKLGEYLKELKYTVDISCRDLGRE